MFRCSTILLALLAIPALSIRPGILKNKRFGDAQNAQKGTTTGFFNQSLNHFLTETVYFSQQYVYSTQYSTTNKFAFLFVSNEGNLETAVLSDPKNPIVKNAKQFGATLFGLEHRFYGLSKPFDEYGSNNLGELNSFQAIYDIISFIKFANTEFKFDKDVKWVLFGVGYGGVLAAEARKIQPKLITGVIASSTPMQRKYDYWEYNDEVKIAITAVGGQRCADNIQQGFGDIAQAMTSPEGRANISTIFQLNPSLANTSLSYNDIQQFYEMIISPFQQVVQFNGEFLKIADMCQIMANTSHIPMQNVYNVYAYTSTMEIGQVAPLITSYQQIVAALSNTSGASPYIDDRLWTWQACTEFGFFYTTNSDLGSIFGNALPTSLFINQCRDIFPDANITATYIRDEITNFNNYYGDSAHFSGTNVVFTYGQFDPTLRLGKVVYTDFSVVTYVISNGSFANDLYPGNFNNSDIDTAHQIISDNINYWLSHPPNPVTSVNTSNPWKRPDVLSDKSELSKERFTELGEDVPSKRQYPNGGIKRVLLGRPPHGLKPAPESDAQKPYPAGFSVGTFRQRVDHFDNTNPNYFNQKYFKNAQWAREGGPNFLMIGGEGPESERWVLNENITYLTWAQKYGATVYLLEHRFYGDSLVGDNTDFRYLTSLQMLYDLAEFIRAINLQSTTQAPWITFGGSYSGAMSAWMREVFPDLVAGAVASSGPVFAKTDFFEYLMVVEDAIRMYNSDCVDRIKSAFDTMHQLVLSKEGRANLSTTFTLQPPFGDVVSELDQQYFFSNIYSNFQGAVQYSGDNTGPYANGYGIADMCKIMTNDSNTPLQNVATFNEFMTSFYNDAPFDGTDNNYTDLVEGLRNAQQYGPSSGAGLLWTWQTCNEFGYFQSADSGNSIFGSPTPVTMYIKLCEDLFNTGGRAFIDSRIQNTNYMYGSRFFYRGTNVVLPNGNVDPWHALGLYYPLDQSVVPYLINGTAHCADMYPARPEDVPGLKIVRDLVDSNIAKWLNQSPVVSTTTALPVTGSTISSNGPTDGKPTTTTQASSSISVVSSILLCISLYLF